MVGPSFADLFEQVANRYPAVGRRMTSAAIPRILPVTAGLGLKVTELDDDRCALRMPFSKKAKNHVGGMYLGVLMIAAEVSMAIYVMRLCRPDRFSVLVKRSTSEFTKQSREPVLALCRPDSELRERVIACADMPPGERDAMTVSVDVLFEGSGERMGGASFDISIMARRR